MFHHGKIFGRVGRVKKNLHSCSRQNRIYVIKYKGYKQINKEQIMTKDVKMGENPLGYEKISVLLKVFI